MPAGLSYHKKEATTSDAVVFPGFPGVWEPGEAKSFEALGLDEKEAVALVKELGLPLEKTSSAPAPRDLDRTAGMVSSADRESEPTVLPTEQVTPPDEPEGNV